MSMLDSRSLRKLSDRRVLSIDPQSGIAVKRNVHEFHLDVPAERFARAFHQVLVEPDTTFGAIEVRRDPARAGEPFSVGERFHGCFSVAASFPRAAGLFDRLRLGGLVRFVENAMLSDYAQIETLIDDGKRFEASYSYLSGSPIAGESRFRVEPHGSGSRLEVVFLYQEIGSAAILVLHRLGARLHDEVVLEQVRRAAVRAGGRVVRSTMEPLVVKKTARENGARRDVERFA